MDNTKMYTFWGHFIQQIFYIMTITPNDQTIHFQQNNIDSKKTNHEVSTQFSTMEYHTNDLKKHLYIMCVLVFWW